MLTVFHFLGLSLFLTLSCAASIDQNSNQFSKASIEFALDLLKNLANSSNENIIFSPTSISIALSVLQQGAKEETAAQLENLLRLNAEESRRGYEKTIKSLKRDKKNVTVVWGNRAYLKPGFEILEDFKQNIRKSFGVAFQKLDFSQPNSASKINNWISEVTHGYIENLVEQRSLTDDTVMVFVNAIYFKGLWDSPFDFSRTRSNNFAARSGDEFAVPFMSQTSELAAGEDAAVGVKWVEMPFQDKQYSMIFVLPTEDHKLDQLIEKLTQDDVHKWFTNEGTRHVILNIPKFKVMEKTSMVEILKQLGVTNIFTQASDLGGISPASKNLIVSEILHQAEVLVDEEGSTAAAATYDIVHTLSLQVYFDELHFNANQPFLFFIVDKTNLLPLFAGRINRPKD